MPSIGLSIGAVHRRAAGVDSYSSYLSSLGPSGYWKLNEASGAATFADSSGNGLTATGVGNYKSGLPAIIPNRALEKSVLWGDQGRGELASSETFDYTAVTAFSFVCTFTQPTTAAASTGFIYSKHDPAGNAPGHYLMTYPSTMEFAYRTSTANRRIYTFTRPSPGVHHIVVSFGGSAAAAPSIWVDGVLQTLSTSNNGTPTTLTNTAKFNLGGRADGNRWEGFMQEAAFFSGKALSSAEVATLWEKHQSVNRSAAIPFILDTDGGSSDKGDIISIAHSIYLHRTGLINLLGIMVTCGDDYSAPASRAILDYYGLTDIPVGAYKGTDAHVGGGAGTPSRLIRDAFDASGLRTDAIYADPDDFYRDILNTQANASVVVSWSGFANSIAAFLNASDANKALWNAKVKLVSCVAGQWPNSSDGASPAGNFAAAGRGEWNLGGSDAGAVGAAEAQAAADFITHSTVTHHWHGIEMCGNTGDSPALGDFITSAIPPAWATSNPLRLGCGTTARTAWDIMGDSSGFHWAWDGLTGSTYWDRTQITAPVIDVSGADQAHNSSSAGSSNNYYLSPDVGPLSTANWRTLMSQVWNALIPPETV